MTSLANDWPALVLNADCRPLSYYPLSLWNWQDTVKAVFLDRVNILAHYDQLVRSPTFEMPSPYMISNSMILNGGAILFLTTLTRV